MAIRIDSLLPVRLCQNNACRSLLVWLGINISDLLLYGLMGAQSAGKISLVLDSEPENYTRWKLSRCTPRAQEGAGTGLSRHVDIDVKAPNINRENDHASLSKNNLLTLIASKSRQAQIIRSRKKKSNTQIAIAN